MLDVATYLSERSRLVDEAMDRMLPPEREPPVRLHRAMRYSLFGAGKRLRPVLCLAAAEAVGGSLTHALHPAAAVEVLHTYTLIHDDLPAMDDDALRRGRATCHKAFDEATAILAGDALLTLSFGLLAETTCTPPYSAVDLVRELALASGSRGVIGGQMADIEGEGQPLTLDQLLYIHTHKTGDLIVAAVRMGAMTGGASGAQLASLTDYARNIGLAFQIADDVLNATGTSDEIGKSAGTDADAGKMTYVAAFGVEGARDKAATLIAEAKDGLSLLPGLTEPLAALADFVVTRRT